MTAVTEEATDTSLYESDKEAAREIQRSLVPAGNLKMPGAEMAFRFSPFAEVGGDFLDFFSLPNGLIGLYIGDVVGKGLAAAMYAALVMGTLRGINKTGEDTPEVLALLNKRLLVRPIRGRYCATIYALFDPLAWLPGIPCFLPPTGSTNCEIIATKISAGTGWASSGAPAPGNPPTNRSTIFSPGPSRSRTLSDSMTTSRP